jgi:hypothetical protein
MGRSRGRGGGFVAVVPQVLNPTAEAGEDVGLLTQGRPQNAIAEAGLHFKIMGQSSGQNGFTNAAQSLNGADHQGAGALGSVLQQIGFDRLAGLGSFYKIER